MSVTDQAATRNFLGAKFQIDEVRYDGNGNVTYIGIASRGSRTSEPKWIIYQLFYDVNNFYTHSRCAGDGQVMDNYATLTYT